MKIDQRLHHYCQNISEGSLEKVLEVYRILGCEVTYRPNGGYRWAMVGQPGLPFVIQIVETGEKPVSDIETKRNSHVAFLSDNPRALVARAEKWAESKDVRFRQGGWSEKELYFDLPDLFVNFVVEVMHTSIIEE